jgi:hypothetical protein
MVAGTVVEREAVITRPHAGRRRALSIALHLGGLLFLAFYFAQHSRTGTNHTDGGLILTYIDDIASGLRPHFDFIDAYGPLNWPFPVLAYKLAGNAEWGVRVWMLILKLFIVAFSYVFVRALAGTLYGVFAGLWMALLFGQAWQSLQTAYAFNNVVPVVIAIWFLLLKRPLRRLASNFALAGVLTGIAIWVKVNSGLFVLYGGLFYLFYWLPPPAGTEPSAFDRRWQKIFRYLRAAGLVAYAGVFYLYLRKNFDGWYFVYLTGPLWIGLLWTWRNEEIGKGQDVAVTHHFRAWGSYLGTCLITVLIVLFGVARTDALRYLKEQSDIFIPLRYEQPFPLLGVPDEFVGFNENFWPQLPWLLTLVFLAWMLLQYRRREVDTFGNDWREEEGRAVGIYMMSTLYLYVLYSRADETHIFQAMIGVPLAVPLLLRQIEALCLRSTEQRSLVLRAGMTATLVAWGSTLVVRPGFAVFDLSTGQRSHPKLRYLYYRELNNPYVRDFSPDITDNEWDRTMDAAARYVDSRTADGEIVLVLDANRLFHIVSNTRPVGGRHHFYFYMISTRLFDRPGFELSVPRSVIQKILDHPPPIVIGATERIPPVAKAFPEIQNLIERRYKLTRNFRHVLIYERDDTLATLQRK